MATWAMRQRYAWIEARLEAGDAFNRDDIVAAFIVTKQTASATIREFEQLQPGRLRYDSSRKAFVRADLPPAPGLTRRETALVDALRNLAIAARTSGGVAGADAALMAACDTAETAIAKLAQTNNQGTDHG